MEEKTLAEILQEELEGIQDLLEPGDILVIQPRSIRLEVLYTPIAIGSQAVGTILGFREHRKDALKMLQQGS